MKKQKQSENPDEIKMAKVYLVQSTTNGKGSRVTNGVLFAETEKQAKSWLTESPYRTNAEIGYYSSLNYVDDIRVDDQIPMFLVAEGG